MSWSVSSISVIAAKWLSFHPSWSTKRILCHYIYLFIEQINFLLQSIAYKIASNFHTIFIRFYVRMRLIFLKYFLNSKTFSQIKLIKKKNFSTLNLHIYKYSVREYYIVNISNVQFRVTKSYNLFKQWLICL